MNKPLCVISCPIDTFSGYGSRARDFVKALYELKKDEWEIKILSQRWGSTSWGYINSEEKEWGFLKDLLLYGNQLTQQPDYWFQITIPNEFQPIGKLMSVGVTAGIETTICDVSWLEGLNRMNMTLASSKHAKDVFTSTNFREQDQNGNIKREIKLEKPVEVLFEGANLDTYYHIEPKDLEKTEVVKAIDEIPEAFNFLVLGSWLNGDLGQDRKNISGTIKLFLETFKNKKNKPGLILKTTRVSNSIMDREEIIETVNKIRSSVNSKDLPNIYLLHGELSDYEINNLYNHPKVKSLLYLGHGEGFGRPILEFSLSKKPIIASAWSGHLDFLSSEFCVLLPGRVDKVHPSATSQNLILPESQWFYVDEKFAQDYMENMYEKYDKYLENAKRQAFKSKKEYSYEKMKELLSTYLDKFPKEMKMQLPKLKKIELPKLKK